MKRSIFTVLFILFLLSPRLGRATTFYAVVTGNWNALTTWTTIGCGSFVNPAVLPGATDDVVVCNGVVLTCNINTIVSSITVSSSATFQNGGASTTNRSVTIVNSLNILNGGTLIQNSVINPTTTLFAGVEFFSPTSLFRVNNWFSNTLSIVSAVSSNFGHVHLNFNTGVTWWNNQGLGVARLIQGDLTIGSTCQTLLDNSSASIAVNVPGNFVLDGKLRVKDANAGTASFSVTGIGTINSTGVFTGIANGSNNFTFSINNLTTLAGSTFNGLLDGTGNTTIQINGVFNCAGNFYGINAPLILNNGVPSITMNSLSYTGGTFMASNTHNVNGLATLSILNNATINFTTATDKINLLGLAAIGGNICTTRLLFTVGGNFTISGLSSCEFKTSETKGEETTIVGGTFTSTAARTIFNGSNVETNGHKVHITLAGLIMSGGTVWASENASDSTFLVVNGVSQISGGTLILKSSTGWARFTINGNFTQNLVSSQFYLHGSNQLAQVGPASDLIEVQVNGNFVQSGGIIYFDNYDSPSLQQININGPTYTISNSASMLRAGSGTSPNFAKINFQYQGTTTFFRNLSHNIRQCKQFIKSGCTVNVTSGPFQISSHSVASVDMLTVESGGILSVGTNQISSDTISAFTGVTISDGGRLRLARTQGLYDNTNNPVFRSSGGMNYFLGANSIVEYNTNTYARVSGINIGVATLPQHKYGILEINHVGPAGTWISPTFQPSFTNAVYVRTRLMITAGEFNLCDAPGNPGSAGRYVYIENPAPTSLVRTGGYIRSEATDHSGRIVWTMANVAGTYIIPFGYSATEYLPLTYQLVSNSAGTVSFSTYRTPATNLPWPSGVTNLFSHIGLTPDNRNATVDRFWRISPSVTTPVANLVLTYASSELPGIPFNSANAMRAHSYNVTTNSWLAASVGQTATAYQVTIPSASNNINWAVASLNAPLPLTWVSISASKDRENVLVKWATLSEKDCDFFTVYKSENNSYWLPLGTLPATGNSNTLKNYSFIDVYAASANAYYRVKETDVNGEEFWSDIAYYASSRNEQSLKAWYHPENSALQVLLPTHASGTLFIYDMMGRLLYQKQSSGESSLMWPVSLPLNTNYLIRFVDDQTDVSVKITL